MGVSVSYTLRITVKSPAAVTTAALATAVEKTGAKLTQLENIRLEKNTQLESPEKLPHAEGRELHAAGSSDDESEKQPCTDPNPDQRVVLLTVDCASASHQEEVVAALQAVPKAEVCGTEDEVFALHEGGKLTTELRAPLEDMTTLARVYSPGVARVCTAINREPALARRYTIRRNTVAIVSDGTAVLGLGDIGPAAALPVMEGKAALFKRFAGVDAWPVVLDTKDPEEIIRIVKAIAPAYGGINLEDISAPRCFEIEKRLRAELDIPVFHDDQHGTAVVVLAALRNALKVTGKNIDDIRIVVNGIGAAGCAIIRLLTVAGARDIVPVDRAGVLKTDATYENPAWQEIAHTTNPAGITGTLREAIAGADVFIGVSAPNLLTGADIATMNANAIVFALANPVPEVDPEEAGRYAAVVATGRSDLPNQINNVLVFPGLFRGLLDADAAAIDDAMLLAAARALADVVGDEVRPDYVIPTAFDSRIAPAVAEAVQDSVERAAPKSAGAASER
ncbi:malate dehydrogenase (oxaloacetate-decarboxylating) [Actinobaculum suis]|uniref:Malate dehydrogenase (Oxaloacetate-decarboxylating) n=2 Tax=Actinobaculum suis TaxID=1657 RepID=A0A1G7DEF3_9ACTO|nr:NADP-dependent malic enzyme [Actinobaculum suis]MDY5154107.1 NADP-dependent malic enzyme [Actinobaculum suis]SDE49974.1 malate dehydrogenase (oxaloacetate-decarboxylating) [Actinobaculum suis]